MADYTHKGRVKLKSTYEPFVRPTFEQWIKELKINHTVWYEDPDGKQKTERIMSHVGVQMDNRTFLEKLTGEEY